MTMNRDAARKPPGRNGYTYRPQYGVIILCDDEADQRARYDALRAQGLRTKVVTV